MRTPFLSLEIVCNLLAAIYICNLLAVPSFDFTPLLLLAPAELRLLLAFDQFRAHLKDKTKQVAANMKTQFSWCKQKQGSKV